VSCECYNGEVDASILARLERRIAQAPFAVHISATFPLTAASTAQRALIAHHLGKLALRVA